MRAKLAPLLPYIHELTQASREKIAGEILSRETARTLITEAAGRGEGSVRLTLGEHMIELRGTEAAAKLLAWCGDQGFRTEWAEVTLERRNGIKLKTAELIISWARDPIASTE